MIIHFDGGIHEYTENSVLAQDMAFEGMNSYIYWGWIMKEEKNVWKNNGINHNYSTNNEAEYMALIQFLKWFVKKINSPSTNKITIKGDSKLILNQVFGNWKVNAENLKPMNSIAKFLVEYIKEEKDCFIEWEHCPRNKLGQVEVDAYAREAVPFSNQTPCGTLEECFCESPSDVVNI